MPSGSERQARFMAACSHGAGYASCPPAQVSHEFNQADKGSALLSHAMKHRYAAGGAISPLSQIAGNPMTERASLPKLGNPMGNAGRLRMPRVPIMGAMHNIDQHMQGARMKMPQLKARVGGPVGRYADGGEVITLGARAIRAVKDALSHLANNDASSAAATLRSSQEAMQHPTVASAAQSLRTSSGIAPATRSLTNIVNQDTDRTVMPLMSRARGGRV